MPNDSSGASAPKDSKERPARKAKPSFDEFSRALKEAVGKPPKFGFREVKRILSTGFSDRETVKFVAPIAEILEHYPSIDRWAVSVAVGDFAGRLKKFQREILTEIRRRFGRKIGFYELSYGELAFEPKFERWLLQNAPPHALHDLRKLESSGNPPEAPASGATSEMARDSWLRWVFVSLLSNMTEHTAAAILILVEFWARKDRVNSEDSELRLDFYRFLSAALSVEKIDYKKTAPLIGVASITRQELLAAREFEKQLSRELADTLARLQKKCDELEGLQQELVVVKDAAEQLSVDLRRSQQQLLEAEERCRLLDEHWSRSSATNVARKLGSLSDEVGHEVQEAILSLDRDSPNLTMALSRLKRLQDIISRQKMHNEHTNR